jgi:hypothetical protein
MTVVILGTDQAGRERVPIWRQRTLVIRSGPEVWGEDPSKYLAAAPKHRAGPVKRGWHELRVCPMRGAPRAGSICDLRALDGTRRKWPEQTIS